MDITRQCQPGYCLHRKAGLVWCLISYFIIFKPFFMATFNNGILGGFSGKVGNVVGGKWKGIDYMRSRSGKRGNNPTPAQQTQQAKFKLAIQFLQPLTGLLSISFRDFAIEMTGINNAMRYLLANAIDGTYPALSINYQNVLISRGDLPNAGSPAATAAGSTVTFTWINNSGTGMANASDQAILVAYCADLKQVEWTMNTAQRVTETGVLPLPGFAGMEVQTWIGFLSTDGRRIASSKYTGAFTL
jgi:hypothetical protein